MKISFIVVAHNEEEYLEKTLLSIKAQTYKNYEIIVVCDMCSDGTAKIAKTCGVTQILERHEKKGIASARNLAVKNSTGDILFLVDAHMTVDKNAAQIVVEEFTNDTGIGAICGYYNSAFEHSDFNRISDLRRIAIHGKGPERIEVSTKHWLIFSGGFAAYRHELYKTKFSSDFDRVASEDIFWSLCVMAKKDKKLIYNPRIRGKHWEKYRKHGTFWKRNILTRVRGNCRLYIKTAVENLEIPYLQFVCSFPTPIISLLPELFSLRKVFTVKEYTLKEKLFLCFYLMVYEYLKILYMFIEYKKVKKYGKPISYIVKNLFKQHVKWLVQSYKPKSLVS